MNDRDFEAVNKLAMEQISRLESSGELPAVETPPALGTQRPSFWSSEYSKYSPSSPSNSTNQVPLLGSTPRTYYTTKTSYEYGSSSPDSFYRRMLNSIYRKETVLEDKNQEAIELSEEEVAEMSGLSFGSSMFDPGDENKIQREAKPKTDTTDSNVINMHTKQTVSVPRKQLKSPKVTQDTKNQLLAIVLSGVTRMGTTMVVNWAKERKVPYELL